MKKKPYENVLMASNDLDIQELLLDVLHIIFNGMEVRKEINFEKALDSGKLYRRLEEDSGSYNLIMIDYHLGDNDEKSIPELLHSKYKDLMQKVVLLVKEDDEPEKNPLFKDISYISKPFSLDDLNHVVREKLTRPA